MARLLIPTAALAAMLGLVIHLRFGIADDKPRVVSPIENPTTSGDHEPIAAAAGVAAPVPAQTAHDSSRPASMAPLPDASLAVEEQLPLLEALAASGSGEAACRLTQLVFDCASRRRSQRFQESVEAHLATSARNRQREELFVGLLAREDGGEATQPDRCAGVDDIQLADPDRYLRATAARMTAHQKTLLAMMRADGQVERLPLTQADLQPMQMDTTFVVPQYLADNAYRFLEEGIAAREPLALEGMLLIHSPSWMPGIVRGARLSLPDPRRFLYYATVMTDLYGEEALGQFAGETRQRVILSIGPEQSSHILSRARAEAARWRSTNGAPAGANKGDRTAGCSG